MDAQLEQRVREKKQEAEEKGIVGKASDVARFLGDGIIRWDPLSEYIFEDEDLKVIDVFNGHYESSGKPRMDERYSLLEGKSWNVQVEYQGEVVFKWHPDSVWNGEFFAPSSSQAVVQSYRLGHDWEHKLDELHRRALDAKQEVSLSLERDLADEERDELQQRETSLRERYGL